MTDEEIVKSFRALALILRSPGDEKVDQYKLKENLELEKEANRLEDRMHELATCVLINEQNMQVSKMDAQRRDQDTNDLIRHRAAIEGIYVDSNARLCATVTTGFQLVADAIKTLGAK